MTLAGAAVVGGWRAFVTVMDEESDGIDLEVVQVADRVGTFEDDAEWVTDVVGVRLLLNRRGAQAAGS